jgi:hypothetical protein
VPFVNDRNCLDAQMYSDIEACRWVSPRTQQQLRWFRSPPGNRRTTWYASCKSESNVARGTL